jgi:hypothetical protein
MEGAQNRLLTNDELNHQLSSKFSSDRRPGHESIITATAVSKPDYHTRMRQIVDFIDSVVVPRKHIKVSALDSMTKTPSPELCRNYTKGTCTRGSECRYSHSAPTVSKPPTPPVNPQENKKPWIKAKRGAPTVVVPAYTVVSKNHSAIAGAPRGVISALNPVMVSKSLNAFSHFACFLIFFLLRFSDRVSGCLSSCLGRVFCCARRCARSGL